MANLVRWDPFTDLRSTMDSLFDQGFSRPWRFLPNAEGGGLFPIEVWETDDTVEIKASLPGVRPEDVDISVANDILTIKAEHKEEVEDKKRSYHRQEISYDSLHRSLSLPMSVDADKAEATFEHGMLYLRLPKAESVKPKQIKVGATNGRSK
jgi:HSP20 family protein